MHNYLPKSIAMLEVFLDSLKKSDKFIWNHWKNSYDSNEIAFQGINFSNIIDKTLIKYDFSGVYFNDCTFKDIQFVECNLERSEFNRCVIEGSRSRFTDSNFKKSNFNFVEFSQVGFSGSILSNCVFKNCQLKELNFYEASLIKSEFYDCLIVDCDIFGANIWSIISENTTQKDLKIPFGQKTINRDKEQITIDDIELANIVYLLAVNSNFTKFINQSKSNFVLILGRFGENLERLRKIKEKLRKENFSPIVFDFESPDTLDLIEMIILLSLLSKFIIVDLSEPKSVPAELQAILSTLMIPVVPILNRNSTVYGTYSFTNRYSWVLPVLIFDNIEEVLKVFKKAIIDPANDLYEEIFKLKNKKTGTREAKDIETDD